MATCKYCRRELAVVCTSQSSVENCYSMLTRVNHMKPNTYPDGHFYEDMAEAMEPRTKTDVIKKPGHYTSWKIEPKTFIVENGLDFATGNVIKYLMRHTLKNGREDLEKAKEYIDWLIQKHYA
jgi:hypothetical protein